MRKIALESIAAGTFAALAMMPAGWLFRLLEMRVGHYGPKFAALYLAQPGPVALFVQHLVLGWVSALPLVVLPLHRMVTGGALGVGAVYGALYYATVNSLALPIYFGDPLPWSLGLAVVLPSLVVHVIFGVAVAFGVLAMRRRGGGGR